MRIRFSGINPGDTKKRRGWLGSSMPFPKVIPHSDGAGVIESVGQGVDPARVGRRVWVFGAQSYRPFGIAAQLTVVPSQQAIDLPDGVADEVGACLGIPGITTHRAVFADSPVTGLTVLGPGGAGRGRDLGRPAGPPGRRDRDRDGAPARRPGAGERLDRGACRRPRPVRSGRRHPSPCARGGSTASSRWPSPTTSTWTPPWPRTTRSSPPTPPAPTAPDFPFWPMLFANLTIRLFGSDDFPAAAKQQAAADLTAAAQDGDLSIPIGVPLPLEQVAEAHDRVDAGTRDRVLLRIPD